jgi:hypothetical protein
VIALERHKEKIMRSSLSGRKRTTRSQRVQQGLWALALMGVALFIAGGVASAADEEGRTGKDESGIQKVWEEVTTADDDEAENGWDALTKGKPILNVRARVEIADIDTNVNGVQIDSLARSEAVTIRTRLGYVTKPWYASSVLMDFENIAALWPSKYWNLVETNTPINFPTDMRGRTAVADPSKTEVNQIFLKIGRKHWYDTWFLGGRQRIVLDDARFIGNVGWRQNEQTYDAGLFKTSGGIEGFQALYSYVGKVRRIFGNRGEVNPARWDWDSKSHVINAHYNKLKFLKATGFVYLLDLSNPTTVGAYLATAQNSSATYGLRATGDVALGDEFNIGYQASYAYQTEYGNNPISYGANYVNGDVKLGFKSLGAVGIGYELLGSDAGNARFVTPLATAHKFNGWADVFLNNGGLNGLQDLYVYVAPKLPWKLKSRLVYHRFWSDESYRASALGDKGLAQEFDALLRRPVGKHLDLLFKSAVLWQDSGAVTNGWNLTNGTRTTANVPNIYRIWMEFTIKI